MYSGHQDCHVTHKGWLLHLFYTNVYSIRTSRVRWQGHVLGSQPDQASSPVQLPPSLALPTCFFAERFAYIFSGRLALCMRQ